MKAVVQRVAAASVAVEDEVIGSIGQGLAILLGVVEGDTEREADFLANKITQLLQRSTGYWERRHRQGSLGRT